MGYKRIASPITTQPRFFDPLGTYLDVGATDAEPSGTEKAKGWLSAFALIGVAVGIMWITRDKPKKRKNPRKPVRRANPDRYGYRYVVSAPDLAGIRFKTLSEARKYAEHYDYNYGFSKIVNVDTGKRVSKKPKPQKYRRRKARK